MTAGANPFEALAEAQIVSPVRSRMRAVGTRRQRAAEARAKVERELEEEGTLLTLYRRQKRDEVERLLAGPYGKDVRGLRSFLRTMTLSSAPALLHLVEQASWIRQLGPDDRFTLLGMIGRGITAARLRHDLAPFDDGVPGEPPKAFEQIKTMLGVR